MIGISAFSAAVIAALDYFRFELERSWIRIGCVSAGVFFASLGMFWLRSGRYGCRSVVLDDEGLTVETKAKRVVLPWHELSEITLVSDSVLQLQSRNASEPLRLENVGFTAEEWRALKDGFQSRGYPLKPSYLTP